MKVNRLTITVTVHRFWLFQFRGLPLSSKSQSIISCSTDRSQSKPEGLFFFSWMHGDVANVVELAGLVGLGDMLEGWDEEQDSESDTGVVLEPEDIYFFVPMTFAHKIAQLMWWEKGVGAHEQG